MIGPFEEDAQLYLKCKSPGGKPAATVTWWNDTINMGGQLAPLRGQRSCRAPWGDGGPIEAVCGQNTSTVGQCRRSHVYYTANSREGRLSHDAISWGLKAPGFT